MPIKLVVSPDEDLKATIIKATNRQTEVKEEDLAALTDFQKYLERYYGAIAKEHQLFYERRSQQYRARAIPGLEKIRIVSIPTQIRAFSSMFLSRAHQASRYYGTLLREVEGNIFREDHPAMAYYASAYGLFRVEYGLRKKEIDNKYRPFKYHMLDLIRLAIAGQEAPSMSSNDFEKYCQNLKTGLWQDLTFNNAVSAACDAIDCIASPEFNRDLAKDSSLPTKLRQLL